MFKRMYLPDKMFMPVLAFDLIMIVISYQLIVQPYYMTLVVLLEEISLCLPATEYVTKDVSDKRSSVFYVECIILICIEASIQLAKLCVQLFAFIRFKCSVIAFDL